MPVYDDWLNLCKKLLNIYVKTYNVVLMIKRKGYNYK